MAEQAALFDTGQFLKRQALTNFENKAQDWLSQARKVARDISHRDGMVTSDDVLAVMGLPAHYHHNIVGCIFHEGFYRIGWRPTIRPQGHGRMIGVWKSAS